METVKEENEKKKEYLKQYGKALRQEKRIEEELERLKLDRMLPGALAADGLPKSSNHWKSASGSMECYICTSISNRYICNGTRSTTVCCSVWTDSANCKRNHNRNTDSLSERNADYGSV